MLTPWLQRMGPESEEQSICLLNAEDEKVNDGGLYFDLCPHDLTFSGLRSSLAGSLKKILPAWRPALFSKREPRKLHETSYLDGLRGVAALVVVLHHTTQFFYPCIRPGYASSETAPNKILSLPFLRIWMSGGPMVSIFFVLSGFVLSLKPLRLARQRRHIEAYECIASSVFRRGPRLYIPCLVVTFALAVAAQAGFMDAAAPRTYPVSATWLTQIWAWLQSSSWFVSPFSEAHSFEQNTWTIPTEFKGSLLVFLTTLGVAKSTPRFRLAFIASLSCFWLYHGWADLFLFSAGMFCAEMRCRATLQQTSSLGPEISMTDTASSSSPPLQQRSPVPHQHQSTIVKLLQFVVFLGCIHLLSMPEPPENVATSPGYITLETVLTPPTWTSHWGPARWCATLGAVALVLTLESAGPESIYQRALTTNFAQYLGDISFSLYLCHGAVLFSLSSRVLRLACAMLNVDMGRGAAGGEDLGYVSALLIMGVVTTPILLCTSETMTRVLDKGAVTIARKMEKW